MHKKVILLRTGCRAHCPFCNPRTPDSISAREMDKIGGEVAGNIDFIASSGATSIEISGNDPAEYSKLPELIKTLKSRGFEHVILSSHAMPFDDGDRAKELVKMGLNGVRIPIYGHTKEQHEKIMGLEGSFDRQIRALTNFLRLGVDTIVYSLVTAYNKKNLSDLAAMTHELVQNHSPKEKRRNHRLYIAMPCIPDYLMGDELAYYVPYRDVKPYIMKLYNYLNQRREEYVRVFDIPYCVIGRENPYFHNYEKVSELSKLTGLQKPAEANRYKNAETVPTYRLKRHIELCKTCRVKERCSGFFANDLARFDIDETQLESL